MTREELENLPFDPDPRITSRAVWWIPGACYVSFFEADEETVMVSYHGNVIRVCLEDLALEAPADEQRRLAA